MAQFASRMQLRGNTKRLSLDTPRGLQCLLRMVQMGERSRAEAMMAQSAYGILTPKSP